jgi:hypothetical protein
MPYQIPLLKPNIKLSWENQPIETDVLNITELCIDPDKTLFVPPERGIYTPGPDIEYLVSEGFACCSGLILQLKGRKGLSMAHVTPIDRLYKTMREENLASLYEQSVFIRGTRSQPAYEVESLLMYKGIERKLVKTDTGQQPFAVVANSLTGLISVVTKTPIQSIFHYRLFD